MGWLRCGRLGLGGGAGRRAWRGRPVLRQSHAVGRGWGVRGGLCGMQLAQSGRPRRLAGPLVSFG